MRIMLRAAMAALSIASIGSAYADGGDGVVANTEFTEIPGVVAQAPVQSAPLVATAQDGQADQTYESHANRTTWLFPPVGKSRPVIPTALSSHAFAHGRLVSEAMRSVICISLFQASQHASRMAS